jgi:phenylpropionate dioxygenase-like ring-hydroxylating dioxygenase large terminal subunit
VSRPHPVRPLPVHRPAPALPRFPVGWYAVAFSSELRTEVLTRRALGREVVVYRTASGAVHVTGAHCPHLGAHFGHGGKVEGELLRCPFHGFQFDGGGACVATPYGKKPPAIRTETLPTRELDGVVFAWFDPAGGLPRFELPTLDGAGWSPPATRSWVIRSHPQEILENSVDFGHFTEVHGYRGVELRRPLEIDGAYLTVGYTATRSGGLLGRLDPMDSLRFHNDIHTHGLGYSRVEIEIEKLGLRIRQLVMPTPLDDERVELRSTTQVRHFPEPAGLGRYLQWLPRAAIADLVARRISALIDGELRPDFAIWENKRYLASPGLAAGDGPIGRYRRWARQFYAEDSALAEEI